MNNRYMSKNLELLIGLQPMTKTEIARRAGISRPHLYRILSGTIRPKINTLCSLARVLGVDVSVIIGDKDMNKVLITGIVTKEIELKETTNKMSFATFTVAVKGRGKDAKTDFINCVAFEKTAEFVSKYFGKGSGIQVCGRLNTRNYEDKDGKTVYVTEVIAEEVEFNGSKKAEDTGSTRPEAEMPW